MSDEKTNEVPTKKKLTLSKETIRNLTESQLDQVKGGLPRDWPWETYKQSTCWLQSC